MKITKFDQMWWVEGHGMFGAHEVGGLLWTLASFSKVVLLVSNVYDQFVQV